MVTMHEARGSGTSRIRARRYKQHRRSSHQPDGDALRCQKGAGILFSPAPPGHPTSSSCSCSHTQPPRFYSTSASSPSQRSPSSRLASAGFSLSQRCSLIRLRPPSSPNPPSTCYPGYRPSLRHPPTRAATPSSHSSRHASTELPPSHPIPQAPSVH
jgi:hypothetical protein